MKTISELSGTVIRMAAAALAEARRSLPAEEPPVGAPPETPAPAATDAPPEAQTDAAPADAAAASPSEGSGPVQPEPEPQEEPGPDREAQRAASEPTPESAAVKAALDEAVAKATGFSGDRLAMVRAAVEVAGTRLRDVRLVRVFGVEEKLSGGRIIGDHQYVVDFFPAAMRQVASSPKDERGGRGSRGGGGGGGGGGGRGAKGSTTGGFSMDSLRDDRKKEGGGRGRPGAPRRPGAPGRPPGGAPKK